MTWLPYPLDTWATEALALDAATEVDIVRGNVRHVAQQPPSGSCAWVANGTRSTTSTAYDDAAVLWRGASRHLRAGLGAEVRDLGFRIGLYVSAGSATVRAMAVRTWRIGGGGTTSVESGAGAVTSVVATAPDEIILTLPMIGLDQCFMTSFGSGGVGRGQVFYQATHLLVQAKVNAAPNVCYLKYCTPYEVDPT